MTTDELKNRTRELIEVKRAWANDTEADILQALLGRIDDLEAVITRESLDPPLSFSTATGLF